MAKILHATANSRKCAGGTQMPPASTPPDSGAAHPPAHDEGMLPIETPSFLAHITKPIGRKAFCYELRISKSLLDQWLSGEKKDPIERTREIMRAAARLYGPDLALDIAQSLIEEFGGLVVLRREESK